MDLSNITDKEIQFNIMMALMRIEGHLSDLVEQSSTVDYIAGGDVDDTSGVSK